MPPTKTKETDGPRTFRVLAPYIRWRKPYRKSGAERVTKVGKTISSADIPLTICLRLVDKGAVEEEE